MFSLSSKQSSNARVFVAGTLALLLLAALPLAAAASHTEIQSYSGDDAYDPAAGSLPAVSTAASSSEAALARFHEVKSVDDPVNGAWSIAQAEFYFGKLGADVAASPTELAASYSGDDAYDPAAGGLEAVSTFAFAASEDEAADCVTPEYTIAESYSGDDAYDPAAGGYPDGTALALACVLPPVFTP